MELKRKECYSKISLVTALLIGEGIRPSSDISKHHFFNIGSLVSSCSTLKYNVNNFHERLFDSAGQRNSFGNIQKPQHILLNGILSNFAPLEELVCLSCCQIGQVDRLNSAPIILYEFFIHTFDYTVQVIGGTCVYLSWDHLKMKLKLDG